ncbi:hypothetical protein ACJIZ3_025428 [Penstemon smallii]|uniref:At1g61320/AtMIF1 LRR domain-containing protein n=1 Tax=Penstemon smallii TaxID=265156 RepID=A0ABD3TVM4_9LAMI
MFWKRNYLKNIDKRDNRLRIRRERNERKNLMKPLGKRKVGNLSHNSSEDRVTKKMRGVVDLISELPEPVIHNIFAKLRSHIDVVRISTLSKRLKSMYNSYMTFDFDERHFKGHARKGRHNKLKAREVKNKLFNNYVENSLAVRIQPALCVDKFSLCVRNLDELRRIRMNEWILVAVCNKVKELEIHVKKKLYPLPDFVLSSSSITSLKLSACVFNHHAMKLDKLRILSMKDTFITHRTIWEIEKACPLIEDLRLVNCKGLLRIDISALLKLKRIEVHECVHLILIEIKAPNLETFWFHAMKNHQCIIEMNGCENLKNLNLRDRRMTDAMFSDYLLKYPLLENLVLQECRSLKRITISSGKLRSLALIRCENLKEANIEAPNLYSFQYNGEGLPFSTINALALRVAKFNFHHTKTSRFFVENKIFFENFQFNGFKLIACSKEDMKIYEEPKKAHLTRNIFCKIEVTNSSTSVLNIVENWLRECKGNRLTLVSLSTELLELIVTTLTNREDNPKCCRYYSKKCWRHCIQDVQILTIGYKTLVDLIWKP